MVWGVLIGFTHYPALSAAGVDILFGADYNAFPDEALAQYYPESPKAKQHGTPQRCVPSA